MKQGLDDFVVESTPVLDLKKHPVDSLPSTQHVSEPGWDSDRTEVYADIDESDAIATLTADSGESYPITTFPFVIGRGNECDLVLQGKGISRKHVEIVFQSGRFVVNDLESLNGLKVNGYKVARVILEEDDTIKLGDVSLVFSSGGSKSSTEEAPDQRKGKHGFFGNKNEDVSEQDDTFGPSPAKKIITNMVIMLAIAIFAGAGYLYLTKQSAQNSSLVQAPVNSTPQNPTVEKSVVGQLEPEKVSPAVKQQPAPSTEVEQAAVSNASNVAPPPPPSFAPPPSIALSPASVSEKPQPVAKLQSKPKPKPAPKPANLNDKAEVAMSRAERLYFNGNGADALKALKPYVGNSAVTGSTRRQVLASYKNVEMLFEQYNEANAAYGRGDKDSAFSLWTDFMSKEQSLFSGRRSSYTRQIATKVVDEYVSRGNAASAKEDYHTAYKYWQKAADIGDSAPAKIALDNLNTRAQQLYRQALRLEYVNSNKAKSMWREVTNLLPPGTDYHTKASSKLAWYEKWGS